LLDVGGKADRYKKSYTREAAHDPSGIAKPQRGRAKRPSRGNVASVRLEVPVARTHVSA
jgi:hypothetical protein